MNKIRYLFACFLGSVHLFVLSTLPLTAYSYFSSTASQIWHRYGIYPVDPLIISGIVLIFNIILCVGAEVLLYIKSSFKDSVICSVLKMAAWIISFVIIFNCAIQDWDNWGAIFYAILYGVNFMFLIVGCIVGIAISRKRT